MTTKDKSTLDTQNYAKLGAYSRLKDLVKAANVAYFEENTPIMPDATYDRLVRRLGELENNLGIVSDLSTTVQEKTTKGFQTVEHAVPMLSVDNAYDDSSLEKWLNSVWDCEPNAFTIQPKIDGLALTLIYENGEYKQAITRGDGNKGDDVTVNAFMLPIPLKLSSAPKRLEVRGEVFMAFEEFERINERLPADVQKYRNPRNLAAGTMKSHSPEDVLNRGLKFIAHGFGLCDDDQAPGLLSARLDYLGKITPYVNAYDWIIKSTVFPKAGISHKDILKAVKALYEERKQLAYPTDGLVIKCDSFASHSQLGASSKYVRWAIAAKLETESVRTKLVRIDWQVGMSGRITPRATLEPVDINGTTISAAGVHNATIVEELGLYDGCEVEIEKAGEIIPQIIDRISPVSGNKGSCARPLVCPCCHEKLKVADPNLFCMNEKCTDIIEGHVLHFVGRDQMDIAGFGEVTVAKIVQAGYIRNVADIYRLKDYEAELVNRCHLGAKTVSKLLEAIEASKKQPFHRVLAGLGIPLIGNKVSRQLVDYYPNLTALVNATPETLPDIFGESTRTAIIEAFLVDKSKPKDLLYQLQSYGVEMLQEKAKVNQATSLTTPVTGKRVCITGTLSEPRSKVMSELIKRGAIEQGNLTSTTDILLAGDEAGSKLDKALKLNIPVYYEKWYKKLLQDYPV